MLYARESMPGNLIDELKGSSDMFRFLGGFLTKHPSRPSTKIGVLYPSKKL